MTLHVIAGAVAGLLSLIAYVPYARDTARGIAQPSRATWIIWSVVGTLLFASYSAAAGGPARWVALADALGPAIIAILALRYGKAGWTWLDAACLFLAGLSLMGWAVTGSPLVALAINLLLAFLGAVPTLRNVYRAPATEPKLVWGLFLTSNVLNLLAIEQWTWSSACYPVYTVVTAGLVNALIWRPSLPPPAAPATSPESPDTADLRGWT